MSSTLTKPLGSAERRWSSDLNSKEPFPAFEDSPYSSTDSLAIDEKEGSSSARIPSPNKRNGPIYNEYWQPRKENHLAWSNGSMNVAGPRSGHGRQKSLSEALRTIRTRKGSVSANAHELAESLKAPLSIRLVVSTSGALRLIGAMLTAVLGSMPCLVLQLRLDQHVFEIHSQRISETNNPHNNTICLRLWVVHFLRLPGPYFPKSTAVCPSIEAWNTIPHTRCYSYDSAPRSLSDRRAYPLLHRHREDSRLSSPHHQRTLTTLHRPRLPLHLPHPLRNSYLPLPHTTDPRCSPSLQRRVLWKSLRHPLRLRRRPHLRHPKHLLQKALQRSCSRRSRWRHLHQPVQKTRQTKLTLLLFWPGFSPHISHLALDRRAAPLLRTAVPHDPRTPFGKAILRLLSPSRILFQWHLPLRAKHTSVHPSLHGLSSHLLCGLPHQARVRYRHRHCLVRQ